VSPSLSLSPSISLALAFALARQPSSNVTGTNRVLVIVIVFIGEWLLCTKRVLIDLVCFVCCVFAIDVPHVQWACTYELSIGGSIVTKHVSVKGFDCKSLAFVHKVYNPSHKLS
jgi:hypothetical protein